MFASRHTGFLNSRSPKPRRALGLVLGLLLLAVQTGIAAHQETHPLGQPDSQCHYCVLGGHLFGMPNVAVPPPVTPTHPQLALPVQVSLTTAAAIRGFLSRAPPAETQARPF
jgi:hypothetical protein